MELHDSTEFDKHFFFNEKVDVLLDPPERIVGGTVISLRGNMIVVKFESGGDESFYLNENKVIKQCDFLNRAQRQTNTQI